jgi:hypothetical protein
MWGWESEQIARAPCSSRCRVSSCEASAELRNFSATERPSGSSRARKTSPIPPAPRKSTNLNRPPMSSLGEWDTARALTTTPGSRNESARSESAHGDRTRTATSPSRFASSAAGSASEACRPRVKTFSISSQGSAGIGTGRPESTAPMCPEREQCLDRGLDRPLI